MNDSSTTEFNRNERTIDLVDKGRGLNEHERHKEGESESVRSEKWEYRIFVVSSSTSFFFLMNIGKRR